MSFRMNISMRIFVSSCLIVLLALGASSCTFSARAIHNDKELAAAERASSRFHELHNQQNFNAIYDLLDKQDHSSGPENVLAQIRASYDKLGRSLESKLVEKKVLPGPTREYTSQVKLAYET